MYINNIQSQIYVKVMKKYSTHFIRRVIAEYIILMEHSVIKYSYKYKQV